MPMETKITIQTKGFQGSGRALQEFATNIHRVLGSRPLDEYGNDTAENMQMEAPVRTGYLRSFIRYYRVNETEIRVVSWAPYSGWVDQGTFRYPGRPFFSNNTLSSSNLLTDRFAMAGGQYWQQLINKYQNMS